MKTNLCISGLSPTYIKKLSKYFASNMDMFYVDVDGLMEYDLINSKEVGDLCGKEYLINLQNKTVKRASNFENSLLAINYSLLSQGQNLKNVKNNCLLIYLHINKDTYEKKLKSEKTGKLARILNLSVFDERSEFLRGKSDLTIYIDGFKLTEIYAKLKESLIEYYKNEG